MSDLARIGKDLLDMGQKILEAHTSTDSPKEKKEDDEEKKKEKMGKRIDLPNPKRAVIIASLKRKLSE
jgi:hypothetical protein